MTTTPAQRSSRLAVSAVVAAGACWGSVVVTIKVAARGLPISTITIIEVATALVVLAGIVLVRQRPVPGPGWSLIVAGVLEPGLAYPLINVGLDRTSGTHAAVIIGLESVAIVVGDALLRTSLPPSRVIVAVTVTVVGATVVASGGGGAATAGGDALVGLGVLVAAAYVLLAARRPAHTDPVTATFYQLLFGGLTVLAVSAAMAGFSRNRVFWGTPTAAEIAAAVATGVLGSVAAFLLYNWALDKVSAGVAGTSLTTVPVFGIAFSAAFLDEAITVRIAVGAVAVAAGIALAATGTGAEIRPEKREVA